MAARSPVAVRVAWITGGLALMATVITVASQFGRSPSDPADKKSFGAPNTSTVATSSGDNSPSISVQGNSGPVTIGQVGQPIVPDETKVAELAHASRATFSTETGYPGGVGEVTEEGAKTFYTWQLGESAYFDFFKDKSIDHVRIQDVILTVTAFEDIKPGPATGLSRDSASKLFVIELEKKDSELPWEFRPKFLLNDPEGKTVRPWDGVQLITNDDETERFWLKVASKSRGKFTYSGKLRVVTRGRVQDIPLFEDRVCSFYK